MGPLEANCWVVSDDANGPAVVIDPGDEADRIMAAIGDRRLAAVILTHGHFDHLGAAAPLASVSGAKLYVHEADADAITSASGSGGALFGFHDHFSPPADVLMKDGDVLAFGELRMTVLHTPGHTPGGVCLLAESPDPASPAHLFSGDTLFSGSVGRSDLSGGDAGVLARSIAGRLAPLDPETLVHPGHGPDTTIRRESRLNPFWPRS